MAKKEIKLQSAEEVKPDLTETEKRKAFQAFWARERKLYNKPSDLESILWAHLESTKNDTPERFELGINHFGFKKPGQ